MNISRHEPDTIPYRKPATHGCKGHRGLLHVWATHEHRDHDGWVQFAFRCVQCGLRDWRNGYRACPHCFAPAEYSSMWRYRQRNGCPSRDRCATRAWLVDAPIHVYFDMCSLCGWNAVTQSTRMPENAVLVHE